MTAQLTPTQTTILEVAADRQDGNLEPLPPTLRGGARAKVIGGLLARGLVAEVAGQHRLTEAGYAAVGRQRPADDVTKRDAAVDVQNLDTSDALQKLEPTSHTIRPGTKLAGLIEALCHPGGATVTQIMANTGWQAHTVRGALSGMVRKKLGLNVQSSKSEGGERVYRIG